MNYTLTDSSKKALLHCSISSQEVERKFKTCKCSFSWNSKEESEKRLQSAAEVVVMALRPIDEEELNVLQSAWVTAGKDYYKNLYNMPKEIEELDIQFNCVSLIKE